MTWWLYLNGVTAAHIGLFWMTKARALPAPQHTLWALALLAPLAVLPLAAGLLLYLWFKSGDDR